MRVRGLCLRCGEVASMSPAITDIYVVGQDVIYARCDTCGRITPVSVTPKMAHDLLAYPPFRRVEDITSTITKQVTVYLRGF